MSIISFSPSLHEFYSPLARAMPAPVSFALGATVQSVPTAKVLWVRNQMAGMEAGVPYAPGLVDFGLELNRIILVRVRDSLAVLQAGLEGARTAGLGAVIMEIWGDAKAYDLTASRRFMLATKASGTRVFLTRIGAQPQPSAADTRWLVQPAVSRPLAFNAPGLPAFEATLLRSRSGLEAQSQFLEWNRDERRFEAIGIANERARAGAPSRTPLSLPLAPIPSYRPDSAAFRRAG